MRYAEVSVNSPVAQRRTFSYSVPVDLNIIQGQPVWVPFGERTLQGIVMELTGSPAVEETREIIGIIEEEPVIPSHHLSLTRWISGYYLSPLFDAVSLVLPPGFERRAITFVKVAGPDADISSLTEEQQKVIKSVPADGMEVGNLEKSLGKKKAQTIISQLVKRGLLIRSYRTGPVRIRPKRELYISLTDSALKDIKLTGKQSALLDYLKTRGQPVAWADVRQKTGCAKAVANALWKKGLIGFQEVEVRREPISYENIPPSPRLTLTPHQRSALESIKTVINSKDEGGNRPGVFLLHGVTGSGKTEVYLQALAEVVKVGKKGIVLVPEIALTPQTIERFAARFPHRVAVFHSRLSLGEQYDEWRRIRNGEFDVVIGSRSALFTPQPDLGIIIIDEEYEWTYKQDTSPRYHARDAALKLAELTGAVVVLGSATPDVETYYRAQTGEYKILELPERVGSRGRLKMPDVEVVDMKEELKAGNRSMFSRSLSEAVNQAVAGHQQVILFLNRRGGATFVQCRRCGFVMRCRRCDVPLTQHITENLLVCHQCNYKAPVPVTCPECGGRQIKFLGVGTQKVAQEVGYMFPRARVMRWDSDVITAESSHEEILKKFRSGDADILIGTQMVAKGLDIPSVTLVGVITADTTLNLPDFRAGERTFQLLSQVAGRAGRGSTEGRVIIQTYSPEHYAVQAAARHDYPGFYRQEIGYRRQLHNPPFSRLASIIYAHPNDAACQREITRMKSQLTAEINTRGMAGISLIGPAPAYIHRRRGRYRWQLLVRGSEVSGLLSSLNFTSGWTIDIDPVSLVQ
jgi:primosomal protein N' (replication factor Y)